MRKNDLDIQIKGARVNNLQNVNVDIPHNQLTIVTGVSGSGKSSLTMDTLFAEGQRRYIESLSSYARQFMKSMQKPDVDLIEGLRPAIAIHQKVITRTPRSTVGSMTEINDYVRLLFAKIGKTFSPISNREVKKDEVADVIEYIQKLELGKKVHILIPLPNEIKKNPRYYFEDLLHKGFSRLFVKEDKSYLLIEDLLNENAVELIYEKYFILIDRFVVKTFEQDELHRLADSVQVAFDETNGDVYLDIESKNTIHFCNRFEADGIRFEEPSVNFFLSNNPYGACPTCEGFGTVIGVDEDLVIPNKNISLHEGAVACWVGDKMHQWQNSFEIKYFNQFPIHKPIKSLSEEEYRFLWNEKGGIHDFFEMVQANTYKIQYRVLNARYRGRAKCPTCLGTRLRQDALYVKINGTDIATLMNMPIRKLFEWIKNLKLSEHDQIIAKRILIEIEIRIQTLLDVGLNYLTLNRSANTLSGGESQRIQLTRVIGSNLSDSLYILDEPSIGLHARDTQRLIGVLKKLRDYGNTVVVVEHDEQIMNEADCIIDMGPFASNLGGRVIAKGTFQSIIKNDESLTGKYLSGKLQVNIEKKKRKGGNRITLHDCYLHNLKNITVDIPLNKIPALTGVSGSGKTSLVKGILYPALRNAKGDFSVKPESFGGLSGDVNAIEHVEMVDQNPIGKSSRSNPVSYIKAFDDIRALFSQQKISKIRGYTPGYFSFNVEGGRCDQCKGEGEITVEMQFLADVHIECEACHGKRFKKEVLEVTYNGKNIAEVLDMSVDEALIYFEANKKIYDKIKCLHDVGLGYMKLGQSSDSISSGEAQRVKLASFLDKSFNGKKIFFIFDEPTTGLHFHDIQKLINSFEALIENGHTILIIEHNGDVIRNADYIIDLGPEGGEEGGEMLFAGEYEGLLKCKKSYTAQYLSKSKINLK